MSSKEQTPIEQILRTTLVIDNPKGIKYAVEKLEAHLNAKVLEALEPYQNLISKLIKEISDADYHESQEHFLKVIIEEMKSIKAKQK